MDYILCNDSNSLCGALGHIRSASYVVLDCEGERPGESDGCVTLVGCRVAGQNFLIDVQEISDADLRPFYDVLESQNVTKVMFDGRADFSQLFNGRGVHLKGVLDLQVADVMSRPLRGETITHQLMRLSPFIPNREVASNPENYRMVHRLLGMNLCLEEYGITGRKGDPMSHSAWRVRPIDSQLLRYAARDLQLIDLLYSRMKNERYIRSDLAEVSKRYVEIWIGGYPPASTKHSLLPLNILTPSQPVSQLVVEIRCESCLRHLPLNCYTNIGLHDMVGNRCFVCRAYEKRSQFTRRRF